MPFQSPAINEESLAAVGRGPLGFGVREPYGAGGMGGSTMAGAWQQLPSWGNAGGILCQSCVMDGEETAPFTPIHVTLGNLLRALCWGHEPFPQACAHGAGGKSAMKNTGRKRCFG